MGADATQERRRLLAIEVADVRTEPQHQARHIRRRGQHGEAGRVFADDGVDAQTRPLGGQLARALLERGGRDVDWHVAHRRALEQRVDHNARLARTAAAELDHLDTAREALGDGDGVTAQERMLAPVEIVLVELADRFEE